MAPIFLPGTPEELDALRAGTVLELTYNDNGGYSLGTVDMVVRFRAVKGVAPTDTDGDGVIDTTTLAHRSRGPAATAGCPHADGDGDGDSRRLAS